jgi:hypothetical protein
VSPSSAIGSLSGYVVSATLARWSLRVDRFNDKERSIALLIQRDRCPATTNGIGSAGRAVVGDKGYLGEDDIRTPYRGRISLPRRRTPTGRMPGSARPANAPMPSSNPAGSRGSSAAALGAPGNWPRPSTSFRLAKSQDDLARDPGWRGLRRADLRVPGFQEADLRTDDGP